VNKKRERATRKKKKEKHDFRQPTTWSTEGKAQSLDQRFIERTHTRKEVDRKRKAAGPKKKRSNASKNRTAELDVASEKRSRIKPKDECCSETPFKRNVLAQVGRAVGSKGTKR